MRRKVIAVVVLAGLFMVGAGTAVATESRNAAVAEAAQEESLRAPSLDEGSGEGAERLRWAA